MAKVIILNLIASFFVSVLSIGSNYCYINRWIALFCKLKRKRKSNGKAARLATIAIAIVCRAITILRERNQEKRQRTDSENKAKKD